jgi:hypothetical protein
MSFHIDGTQGVQYNDVNLGNLFKVSSAIINRQSLIVRDSAEGPVLDVANIFDSIGESFSTLLRRSDQKERVIAALNSFYPEHEEELCRLSPNLLQLLSIGLEDMQRAMTLSPSFHGPSGRPMMFDLSQSRHARQDERQRTVPAASCLSQAIGAVNNALSDSTEINPIAELVYAEDTPPDSLEEKFLLIEKFEEDAATSQDARLQPEEDSTAIEDDDFDEPNPALLRLVAALNNAPSTAPVLDVPKNIL